MSEKEIIAKLQELISLPGETEWVEFKHNNYRPDEIGEYISALSNSACLHRKDKAYLIFGIEDGAHEVLGTDFDPANEKVGNEELENWLCHLLVPRIDFKIYKLLFQNQKVVVFEIYPARSGPVRFKGTEYIRVGTYKKKLAEHPEKERKIWEKTGQHVFELGIALGGLTSDQVLELLDYAAFFTLVKQPLPSEKQGILNKLKEEKLISEHGHCWTITNLGAILLARDLSKFEKLLRKVVRVIVYKGRNRLNTIKEQPGSKGYAIGFEGLVNYINDQLPANEEIGKAFRKEVKMYPEIAIRELVANALIHQDFSETGNGPMIEIFEDRIEISNPGKPLIDTLRFIDHSPRSRNEKLAQFMRRVFICEERGSGIDKVIHSVEVFQLPAPSFVAEKDFLRVIMYAHKSPRQMDKQDKIRACYQHCCLKYASNEYMTNQSLRERFKIETKNYATVSRIIADTIKGKLNKGLHSWK